MILFSTAFRPALLCDVELVFTVSEATTDPRSEVNFEKLIVAQLVKILPIFFVP
jgi:hypothetical protein